MMQTLGCHCIFRIFLANRQPPKGIRKNKSRGLDFQTGASELVRCPSGRLAPLCRWAEIGLSREYHDRQQRVP